MIRLSRSTTFYACNFFSLLLELLPPQSSDSPINFRFNDYAISRCVNYISYFRSLLFFFLLTLYESVLIPTRAIIMWILRKNFWISLKQENRYNKLFETDIINLLKCLVLLFTWICEKIKILKVAKKFVYWNIIYRIINKREIYRMINK